MLMASPLFAHWVNTTKGEGSKTDNAKYACALISNGSISTTIDNLGVQKQKKYVSFRPTVSWAGRRYGVPTDTLIPFGYFDTELSINGKKQDKPIKWEQSLNNKEAFSQNKVEYPDATIETITFVPMQCDMLVVKKIVTPKTDSIVDFNFVYNFDNYSTQKKVDRVFINNKTIAPNSASFEYRAIGHKDYTGIITITSDTPSAPSFEKEKVAKLSSSIKASPAKPLEITYFITYSDNFPKGDYKAKDKLAKEIVAKKGFDGLLAEHKSAWAKYWEGSHINIPNKEIEKTYYTGLYHQRCNATQWSLPVGIFADSHWNGRFFGWDEAFNAMALATSGKFEQSRKPSDFRIKTLNGAIWRANKGNDNKRKCGCRYSWEALEDGHEGSPLGYWIEHIFHMSNMVMSAWGHYLYTNDKEFLKNSYELFVESSLYYIKNHVYVNDGKYTIGKCTEDRKSVV